MKVQFVLASFLVCSLVGELFGELVEESDYVLLDNEDSLPERRAAMYDPGCVKVPDSKVYTRGVYPRRNTKFTAQKSSMAYGKVQFPRYQDIASSSNYKNMPDFPGNQYSTFNKRYNDNARYANYGKVKRFPFKPVSNFGPDGQFMGADKGKRNGRVYMMSLRDKKGREVYRRMLDAAEAEEDEIEEAQDY